MRYVLLLLAAAAISVVSSVGTTAYYMHHGGSFVVRDITVIDADAKPRIRIGTHDEQDGPAHRSLASHIILLEQDGRSTFSIVQWYGITSMEFHNPADPSQCDIHLANGPNGPTCYAGVFPKP